MTETPITFGPRSGLFGVLSLSPEVALTHAGLLKGGLTGNGFVRLSEPPAATESKTADARTASAW